MFVNEMNESINQMFVRQENIHQFSINIGSFIKKEPTNNDDDGNDVMNAMPDFTNNRLHIRTNTVCKYSNCKVQLSVGLLLPVSQKWMLQYASISY